MTLGGATTLGMINVEVDCYAKADLIQLTANRAALAYATYAVKHDPHCRALRHGCIVGGVLMMDPANLQFQINKRLPLFSCPRPRPRRWNECSRIGVLRSGGAAAQPENAFRLSLTLGSRLYRRGDASHARSFPKRRRDVATATCSLDSELWSALQLLRAAF